MSNPAFVGRQASIASNAVTLRVSRLNSTPIRWIGSPRPRYGISRAPCEAFVLSGHAFLMNVHEELCPSGPYLWRYDRFFGTGAR